MTEPSCSGPGPDRVCIRTPNWVGDVVMATPVFRAVREHLPDAWITVVVHDRVAAVLDGASWFDDRIIYAPGGPLVTARAFLRCAAALRKGHLELGLILPNSFSSALMMWLGGVAQRVGYRRDGRGFLLTDGIDRPSENGRFRPTYMVDYYLALCEAAGVPAGRRDMELPFSGGDTARAESIMLSRGVPPEGRPILLHPGAGYGPAKRWPVRHFARLADMLHERFGRAVALIGGPGERRTIQEIASAAGTEPGNLCASGIDLHLLKCVVARSSLLVTTDSGPRHYGVALGVPTVCIMGPTHPAYSTSGLAHDRVVRLDVDCGPCQRKECPSDHRCMVDITPEMVLDACASALAESGRTEARDKA